CRRLHRSAGSALAGTPDGTAAAAGGDLLAATSSRDTGPLRLRRRPRTRARRPPPGRRRRRAAGRNAGHTAAPPGGAQFGQPARPRPEPAPGRRDACPAVWAPQPLFTLRTAAVGRDRSHACAIHGSGATLPGAIDGLGRARAAPARPERGEASGTCGGPISALR